jgi:hypothetical protein
MAVLAMKLTEATTSSRGRLRRTSIMGRRARTCSVFSARNTGLSSIRRRMNSPTPTSTMLNRNGRRQPQLANCSSLMAAPMTTNTSWARISPAGTPICE